MEQKTDRLFPSAPLERDDLEQKSEKSLNDVNSFNNHINNVKEMTTYFKDKNYKSKKKHKNRQTLNTILESVDTIDFMGATSTSITFLVTGVGLIILKISAGIACTLSIDYKVLQKMIMNKYNKYKKQHERDQQFIKSFDKLYRN